MKIEIKEGMSQKEIEKELAKLEKTGKKADLKKYIGNKINSVQILKV